MAAAPVSYSRLKLQLILEQPGALVLRHTLDSGTHNTESLDLDSYLASLPPDSPVNYSSFSNKDKKKQFDNSQKKQIRNNPKWDNFDVTLLYKSIQLACRDMAPINDAKWNDDKELEGVLKKIKEERNCIIHEGPDISNKDFENKVNELESLFTSVLNLVQVKYNVPPSDTTRVQNDVRSLVDKIRKCLDFDQILQAGSQPLMSQFRTMGKDHLKKAFENVQFFDPMHFLSGSDRNSISISKIFSNLRVKGKKDSTLNALDVLSLTVKQQHSSSMSGPSPPPPQLVVVSGDAGSGKTTLLTFIMANWVGCAGNTSVMHLDTYDFVLRVVCRDREADSLKDFVDLVFSDIYRNEVSNMFLLRKSRVLFLIDGLDEVNATSDSLVQDILKYCSLQSNFTALCTSRPERVHGFLALAPQGLRGCEAEIKRVEPSARTDFVLRYVASLAPNTAPDPGKVKEVMDAIGWRDHFGLPLNLLFLASLITDSKDCTKLCRTQTSLYVLMQEWCVERLNIRLALKVNIGQRKRMAGIREVIKKMCFICLKGLLEDRLYLSDEDIEDLDSCCEAQKLPSEEFLGAFFSFRKDITNRVARPNYLTPHKALQEHYSSQHIVGQLHAESAGKSIKGLLQECLQTGSVNIKNLRNLLLHVAGLLSRRDKPLLTGAVKEVVDLLAESGVEDCKEWLYLLADTGVNDAVVSHVAHHVDRRTHCRKMSASIGCIEPVSVEDGEPVSIEDGEPVSIEEGKPVRITDTIVFSAEALLPHIFRRKIEIYLFEETSSSVEVFEAFATHICTVLHLGHHFRNPGSTAASSLLLRCLSDRSHLEEFCGHLEPEDLALLPRGLESLGLSVAGIPDLEKLLQALGHGENFPELKRLYIHIPVPSVSPESLSSLTPLPSVLAVRLYLSGVGDGQVDAACRLVGAMWPRKMEGYWCIFFPGASLREEGWLQLVMGLRREQEVMWRRMEEEEGGYEEEEEEEEEEKKEERERKRREMRERERLVRGYVVVPSTFITEDEGTQLNALTRFFLGCYFMRWTEDMWKNAPF